VININVASVSAYKETTGGTISGERDITFKMERTAVAAVDVLPRSRGGGSRTESPLGKRQSQRPSAELRSDV